MEIKVQTQQFGQNKWVTKSLLLPDHVAPYFEKYNLDIVEYPIQRCMSLFFRSKNTGVDVWSHTIDRPSIQANIINGFKNAFEELAKLETVQNVKPTVYANEGLDI